MATKQKAHLEEPKPEFDFSKTVPKKTKENSPGFYTTGKKEKLTLAEVRRQLAGLAAQQEFKIPRQALDEISDEIIKLPGSGARAAIGQIRDSNAFGMMAKAADKHEFMVFEGLDSHFLRQFIRFAKKEITPDQFTVSIYAIERIDILLDKHSNALAPEQVIGFLVSPNLYVDKEKAADCFNRLIQICRERKLNATGLLKSYGMDIDSEYGRNLIFKALTFGSFQGKKENEIFTPGEMAKVLLALTKPLYNESGSMGRRYFESLNACIRKLAIAGKTDLMPYLSKVLTDVKVRNLIAPGEYWKTNSGYVKKLQLSIRVATADGIGIESKERIFASHAMAWSRLEYPEMSAQVDTLMAEERVFSKYVDKYGVKPAGIPGFLDGKLGIGDEPGTARFESDFASKINEVAGKLGIAPCFLAASIFQEGLAWNFDKLRTKAPNINTANTVGMESFINDLPILMKKGYLRKLEKGTDYFVPDSPRFINEANDSFIRAELNDYSVLVEAFGAMLKLRQDRFLSFCKENGVNPTPDQAMVGTYIFYNARDPKGTINKIGVENLTSKYAGEKDIRSARFNAMRVYVTALALKELDVF